MKESKGAGIGFGLLSKNTDEYGQDGVLMKALSTHVLPFINPKNKLLEIGTGPGNLTLILSKLFDEAVIVEPEKKFFDMVTNLIKCRGFNKKWEDVEIGKDKFDLILAIHILYYIPKRAWLRQIERMLSVLGENGKLVIVLQSKASDLYTFPNKFLKRESRINAEELMQILHDARIKLTSRKLKTEIWANSKKEAKILGEFLLDAQNAPYSKDAALGLWEYGKGNKFFVTNVEDMIIVSKNSRRSWKDKSTEGDDPRISSQGDSGRAHFSLARMTGRKQFAQDKYSREFIFCLKHIDLHQPILKSFKKNILTPSFLAREHFDILDVGSGEGSLIFKVVKTLLSLRKKGSISIYALEPSPHFAKLLKKKASKINSNVCKIKTIPLTLEKFLSSRIKVKFDFILASHVFYHFPNWLATINNLKKLLKDKSKMLIILESIKSSQYQLKPKLYMPLKKRINEFGKGVTIETSLVNHLKNALVPFRFEELYSKLHFSPNIGKTIEEVLRIVAFLFRYEIKDISTQKNKILIRNFLKDKFNKKKSRFELDYVSDLVILKS